MAGGTAGEHCRQAGRHGGHQALPDACGSQLRGGSGVRQRTPRCARAAARAGAQGSGRGGAPTCQSSASSSRLRGRRVPPPWASFACSQSTSPTPAAAAAAAAGGRTEGVVHHLGQGRQAVGGAGGVGHHILSLGVVLVVVHALCGRWAGRGGRVRRGRRAGPAPGAPRRPGRAHAAPRGQRRRSAPGWRALHATRPRPNGGGAP